MKRLPRKVKVGSHTYTIVRKSAKDMPPDQLGDCDFNKLEIQILQKLPPDKLREVALHEIIHTCTYPNLVDKTDIDEAFVEMIAPNLMNVLRENPKFVEFLLDARPSDVLPQGTDRNVRSTGDGVHAGDAGGVQLPLRNDHTDRKANNSKAISSDDPGVAGVPHDE